MVASPLISCLTLLEVSVRVNGELYPIAVPSANDVAHSVL